MVAAIIEIITATGEKLEAWMLLGHVIIICLGNLHTPSLGIAGPRFCARRGLSFEDRLLINVKLYSGFS